MCSNTGNSGCGCGTGSNGASIWSSGAKKQQKRPRVPKRGPGVAELEKILREQENIEMPDRGNGEGFSFPHHHSNPNHSSSLKSHPPPPSPPPRRLTIPSPPGPASHVPSVPTSDHLGPTTPPSMTSVYGHSGCSTPPHMMNQFLGAGTPASSGSFPIGLHNHIEPPSNQSLYYNPTSKALEEHKVASMKRSNHPSLDNSLIRPPNFQVSPIFSNFNRPQQLSVSDNQGASIFTSANESYKDAKWGSSLELNSRKLNSGYANFPPFSTPEVHPPPMHLFQGVLSKGDVLTYQATKDRTEDSNHRSESSELDHRPFYNFLEVKDPEWWKDSAGPNHRQHEAGSRGIDLSLKL